MNRNEQTQVEEISPYRESASSIVKIGGDRKPSATDCRVVYYLDGKRHRLSVGNLDAAKAEAAITADPIDWRGLGRNSGNRERSTIQGRARDPVRPFGALLDAGAVEYADTKIVLEAYSLIEAEQSSMRHRAKGIAAKLVAKAGIDLPGSKADARRSERYLKDIAYRRLSFAKAFQCDVLHPPPKRYPTL